MPMITSLRTLTAPEVLERFQALRTRQPVKYWAFYSSQLGGIVTDPALMVLPFDDHMVHRGHGIFDTAALTAGKIYDLEAHLDRFIRSARTSKLQSSRARRDARHHRADGGGQRAARRLHPLLGLRWTGQSRAHPGGRRRAGILRHDLRRPDYPQPGTRKAWGDDDDLPHQAAPLRGHQEHQLPAQRPHPAGGQRPARQRCLRRRRRQRRRELQHQRRLRHPGRRLQATPSSTTSCPAARRCACWNWPPAL